MVHPGHRRIDAGRIPCEAEPTRRFMELARRLRGLPNLRCPLSTHVRHPAQGHHLRRAATFPLRAAAPVCACGLGCVELDQVDGGAFQTCRLCHDGRAGIRGGGGGGGDVPTAPLSIRVLQSHERRSRGRRDALRDRVLRPQLQGAGGQARRPDVGNGTRTLPGRELHRNRLRNPCLPVDGAHAR